METKTRHTPTLEIYEDGYYVFDAATKQMYCRAETPGKAKTIVLCVNLHDELVEALRRMLHILYSPSTAGHRTAQYLQEAEAVLAKVKPWA